jgi:molybdopterin molybdotransferase
MPEFLTLLPPPAARDLLLSHLDAQPTLEKIITARALGRVTAAPVLAPHPLPEFPRTTVDGYAVRAADTFGASEGLPAYLNLIGEVPMGGSPDFDLGPTECALIHTGGMVPAGADAIVMVEYTQTAREKEVEILGAVAVGENILNIGEDVKTGQEVIPTGTVLRPAEIGGLMALGFTAVVVSKRPKVGIISSGDEVIPPEQHPVPGQVRDVNAYTLSALVEEAGGEPVYYGIVGDTEDAMLLTTQQAQTECEIVVITAGSSASTRDLTSIVIDQLGEPGVLVHGVNVRPGKPTILAVCDNTAMIGLPGNPVSALVIAGLFVTPVIKKLLGENISRPRARIPAKLSLNLSSQTGREDWIAVKLTRTADGYLADPIFGRSNLIFTLARADGLIRIHPDANGIAAGELVDVFLM